MTAAINYLKSFFLIGLYAALSILFIANFSTLLSTSQLLIERIGTMSSAEIGSVKITFDQASVFSQLNLPDLNTAKKENALQKVKSLEPDEFQRLMNVGQIGNLCDYDRPTADMRDAIAIDYRLQKKKLAEIIDSPDLLIEITARLKADEKKDGKVSEIGYPRSCYVMALTDTGHDVKTALVGLLSSAFVSHIAMK